MMGESLGENGMLVAGGLYDQPLEFWQYRGAANIWYVMGIVSQPDYEADKHPELNDSADLIKDINAALREAKTSA